MMTFGGSKELPEGATREDIREAEEELRRELAEYVVSKALVVKNERFNRITARIIVPGGLDMMKLASDMHYFYHIMSLRLNGADNILRLQLGLKQIWGDVFGDAAACPEWMFWDEKGGQ